MRLRRNIAIVLVLFTLKLSANDSLVISGLLQRIGNLQAADNRVFPKGSIPSYRSYALNREVYKADINPFFTGLVSFTLQDIRAELSPAQRIQADAIIADGSLIYNKFRNRRNNRNTYNFWPTDTPRIFPNGGWLNWADRKQALADDLDDTVILLMAQRESRSAAEEIHALMQRYTNNEKKRIRNTYRDYRAVGAYSTWFGKKMPVDFDVCVLSNILYFVQFYNLAWTAADSASLRVIERTLENRRYISGSAYVSPHYVTAPNILYHISRLMSLRPIPELEKWKPQLIVDAQHALSNARTFMDRVILSTALLRWGVIPPPIEVHSSGGLQAEVEDTRFCFFIANIASMLPNPFKQWVGAAAVWRFYYYCPAYNNLLLVENLAWRKRRGLSLGQ